MNIFYVHPWPQRQWRDSIQQNMCNSVAWNMCLLSGLVIIILSLYCLYYSIFITTFINILVVGQSLKSVHLFSEGELELDSWSSYYSMSFELSKSLIFNQMILSYIKSIILKCKFHTQEWMICKLRYKKDWEFTSKIIIQLNK